MWFVNAFTVFTIYSEWRVKKKITDFDPLIQKNNVTDTLIDKDDIFFSSLRLGRHLFPVYSRNSLCRQSVISCTFPFTVTILK